MSATAPASSDGATLVAEAQRLADELLFPAALATDRDGAIPPALLDAIADCGLYGLSGPRDAGGAGADFATVCAAVEALASGCLTTAFVWAQHLGAVRAVATSDNESVHQFLVPLCRGRRRAGLALGGALPGPPQLLAEERSNGWSFAGVSPFVSGWGRIDLIHTAARTADGRLIWALVDASESDTLDVERLALAALDATATVRAVFRDHFVAAERVTAVVAYGEGPPPPELLRVHAAFPLGVIRRCLALLGPTPLAAEHAALRAQLDEPAAATIERGRAAAAELALRAAAAVAVSGGARSILLAEHGQRLLREALFCLVYALPRGAREALLDRLGVASSRPH